MKVGFGRREITPRVGVELLGFPPFLNRHSIGVRDRLWARAMAVGDGEKTVVLVSCDLVGVSAETTRRVRQLVKQATGLGEETVMVQGTHTHSGPATFSFRSQGCSGFVDPPYVEILPQRIAAACIEAVGKMAEASFSHAEVPCEGIGLNREYDKDAPPLDKVLRDDWRPSKPELTDTTCHVVRVESEGRLVGFFSYFGCHPVVCCAACRYIHGDFVGVATNMLEREHPGSVGLFLQGAQGDVNSCVVHKPEAESLLALDVIASRYAGSVRAGLDAAEPMPVDSINCASRKVVFPHVRPDIEKLRSLLAEKESVVHAPDADDADFDVRLAMVYVITLRSILDELQGGQPMDEQVEVQGFRIGPMMLLGSPFETFHAIKRDVVAAAPAPITLVMSLVNDILCYAPDRTAAAAGEGYGAGLAPVLCGRLPWDDAHGKLVAAMLDLAAALK